LDSANNQIFSAVLLYSSPPVHPPDLSQFGIKGCSQLFEHKRTTQPIHNPQSEFIGQSQLKEFSFEH
jgi:hypothetical protein